jgi:hypothetical protein
MPSIFNLPNQMPKAMINPYTTTAWAIEGSVNKLFSQSIQKN